MSDYFRFSPEALLLPWVDSLRNFPKKVLLIPPDFSRITSGSGVLCSFLYNEFVKRGSSVSVLPATGTHHPMTIKEISQMFPQIPTNNSTFLKHHWNNEKQLKILHRGGVQDFLSNEESSFFHNWLLKKSFSFAINKVLFDDFDKIISIGQVLPHEVVGISNYTKNIIVGLGNNDIINSTHFLSALYGIENILGKLQNPVRKLIDSFARKYLPPQVTYILAVCNYHPSFSIKTYIGKDFSTFFCAGTHSIEVNLKIVDSPLEQVVAYMPPDKFSSTWLANKAIYRLRKIMKKDGILWIVAPGVCNFSTDKNLDSLISQFGYRDAEQISKYISTSTELKENLCVAAHLIHGNVNNQFRIVYCCNTSMISKEKIESVGFEYLALQDLEKETSVNMKNLMNSPQSELIASKNPGTFLINDPSLGCWSLKNE